MGNPKILVIAPFMHFHGGHWDMFPRNLACGFALNGAEVTLAYPVLTRDILNLFNLPVRRICLTDMSSGFPAWLRWAWPRLAGDPVYQCIAWTLTLPKGSYDLVYWTDFQAGNQKRIWPLALFRRLGLYPYKTGFTEHFAFAWRAHILQRNLGLDRVRLRGFHMFVHSGPLLALLRKAMAYPEVGHYIPWGLWPDPIREDERAAARLELEIPDEARVLLVFGTQQVERKQIDVLASVLGRMELAKPLVLIFAGKTIEGEVHPFDGHCIGERNNLRVITELKVIPEERIRLYFSCADGIWANYKTFLAASGVLTDALGAGRLVIGRDCGEIGALCRDHDFALLCPADGNDAVERILNEFLEMSDVDLRRYEEASRRAAGSFSWTKFAEEILKVTGVRE